MLISLRRDRPGSWRPGRDHLHLLGSLVGAGVRVDAGLDTLAAAASTSTTRRAAADAARQVRSGSPFAVVLEGLGAPAHVVALVSAGERSGRLGPALRAAGDLVGVLEELRTTVRRALVYPTLILAIGVAMTTVIVVAVVPALERTFLDLGGQMPLPTRLVIAAGRILRGPWSVGVLLAGAVLVRFVATTDVGRRAADSLRRWAPFVRPLHADLDVAVLATMLATMLRSGIPFADALDTCRMTVRVGSARTAVAASADAVRSGRSAFAPDGLGSLLSPAEREIVAVAEVGGMLAEQLERVAELRRDGLASRVARLGSSLEPLLVLIVGLVVGGVVLALYLPTFRVLELI